MHQRAMQEASKEIAVEQSDRSAISAGAVRKSACAEYCMNCGEEVELLWVHGHYQCPVCRKVVVSCCEGITD